MNRKPTLGELWHEEVENESVLIDFLVFFGAIFLVLTILVFWPGEAQALEMGAMSETVKADAAYEKYKTHMTAKQKKAYLKSYSEGETSTCRKYIVRAKLDCKLKGARKFSLSKASYVWKWGNKINKYLRKSPMKGTGYLTAKWAYKTKIDPRLSPAIAHVESKLGRYPYGSKYNVWGWTWNPPAMRSWDDAIGKWHRHFKKIFKGERYPIKSMHGYCSYSPWHVNVQMAKIK